jgi:hypothetical protein
MEKEVQMANGCFNAIRIDGEKEKVEKVLELLKRAEVEGKFFDLLYPVPKELRTEEERFGDGWCVDHWGTQYDAQITTASTNRVTERTLLLTFSTQWSPPIPFFEKFSKDFQVDVEIRYIADRNIFVGRAVWKIGESISNECIERPTQEDLRRPDLDYSKIV